MQRVSLVSEELNADEQKTANAGAVSSSDERYSRQILFRPIGAVGQERLSKSHVAIAGCGAIGAAAALLLARAGVGTLSLIDRDFVEISNLQRQVLFDEADARESLPKAEAARRKIFLFNSSIQVNAKIADLVPENIEQILEPADIVLDGTDNFETRFLINDFAVKWGKPWIYGAAIGTYAATMNILPATASFTGDRTEETLEHPPTACLACIFPEPPAGAGATCDTDGILSPTVNLVASIQVTEVLKFLTGNAQAMRRSLYTFDLWTNDRSEVATARPNPQCRVCVDRIFHHLRGEGRPHITLCGRNSVQIHERRRPVDLAAMRDRLLLHGAVRSNDLLLRFELPPFTMTLFADGRAIIQGTTEASVARTFYARYVGS